MVEWPIQFDDGHAFLMNVNVACCSEMFEKENICPGCDQDKRALTSSIDYRTGEQTPLLYAIYYEH